MYCIFNAIDSMQTCTCISYVNQNVAAYTCVGLFMLVVGIVSYS